MVLDICNFCRILEFFTRVFLALYIFSKCRIKKAVQCLCLNRVENIWKRNWFNWFSLRFDQFCPSICFRMFLYLCALNFPMCYEFRNQSAQMIWLCYEKRLLKTILTILLCFSCQLPLRLIPIQRKWKPTRNSQRYPKTFMWVLGSL